MKVFYHHIYEYEKGIRNLILHTLPKSDQEIVEKKLNARDIAYLIRQVDENKINVFFGEETCVEAIKMFGNKSLTNFTDEEDFILGTMLGYDRLKQVKRYLTRKNKRRVQWKH